MLLLVIKYLSFVIYCILCITGICIDTTWVIGLINGKLLPGKSAHTYVTIYCSIAVAFTIGMMGALVSIWCSLKSDP